MSDRLNIILIVTDQHRLSGVGAYGETPCRTPNIDRLAHEGVLFENAYIVCPVCSPARATIQTGLFPHSHGISTNIHEVGCSIHELEDRPSLLPRRLQAGGYRTGFMGKWHLGTRKTGTFGGSNTGSLPSSIGYEGQDFPDHGDDGAGYPQYQEWIRSRGYASYGVTAWSETVKKVREDLGELIVPSDATVPAFLVESTIDMVRTFTESARPYFIALNFWGPHQPYQATKEFLDHYRRIEIPPWPNYDWPSREIPGPHHLKIHWDKEALSWDDWGVAVRYYYARVSMIDSQIGRLYENLKSSGELSRTVLIFTADHGETLGSHGGLLDKGWHHFEETHRIPMIIRFPDDSHAGSRISELVSLVDIFPTILEIAECQYDRTATHGKSLVPLVHGQKSNWRDSVVTEFLGLGGVATSMKTLRKGDFKYGCNLAGQDEFYDLGTDPYEMRNVVADPRYRRKVSELKENLKSWMVDTEDPALRSLRWRDGERIE